MSIFHLNHASVSSVPRSIFIGGLKLWAERVLCFILPLSTFLCLSTAPHTWNAALIWTMPVWLCIIADYFSPKDQSIPKPSAMDWWFDARLYVLFALQIANIILLLEVTSRLVWSTPLDSATSAAHIVMFRILVGTTSCCSGIAIAHELLHRRARHLRLMGRMLLWTVCYDHFALEHAHGHHRMVGTSADPATACFGEMFSDFFRRSVSGQLRNAWHLETHRLQHRKGMGRLFRNRMLHGLVIEFGLFVLIFQYYGVIAWLMFVYQAAVALRMLEAVNYLQHWGLIRNGSKLAGNCAWDTDSWFTLHSFIGLSRHADHHTHAGKPYQRLRHVSGCPKLPHGYFYMLMMIRLGNAKYVEMASQELIEKNLVHSIVGRHDLALL